MIDEVVVTSYGRAASLALADAVARSKGGSVLAPVTVIVPSNLAGLTARRRLAGSVGLGGSAEHVRGVANVAFLTPFRLAEMLSADLMLETGRVTNPVLGAAVRLALADDPGPFLAVRDHHATQAALASIYSELSSLSESAIDRLATEGSRAAKTAVDLYRSIRSKLGATHDEAEMARAAASRPDLSRALSAFGHVVWYLPEPLSAPLAGCIRKVLLAARSDVIIGASGDPQADAAVRSTCERAGVSFPGHTSLPEPATAAEIISATDADEEVRAVVRRVAKLVEGGVALDRIGVFLPAPVPYLTIVEQQFAAAGIPANGPSRRRLAESAAGRTLLAALALPAERWRHDRVMALVAGAPVRHGDGLARPSSWETLSREAGVVKDLADWRRKLDGRQRLNEAALAELPPDAAQSRRDFLHRQHRDLADLESFVTGLDAAVRAVSSAQGWLAKTTAASTLLHHLLGGGHLHGNWPEAEQTAFERVEDSLTRLAGLDSIEPDPTEQVFVRALQAELDVTRGRSGRFGDGMIYGPLASAVGHDLDAVFVLGCAEGILPMPRRDDALLPDEDRDRTGGELAPRGSLLHDQHRLFLAALASAPAERRVLTFPRGDLRSNRRALPSRWLLDTASGLAGKTVYATDFADLDGSVVQAVPSFATGVRLAQTFGSVGERDLAAVDAYVNDGGLAAQHPVASSLVRGLAAQRERRSADLTEWDGNLAGQPIPSTADRPLSPTRLQTWAKCGYRYFLAYVLRLDDRDDPERVVDMGPLDRGSAVHSILEQFILEAIESGAPEPDAGWSPLHRARLREIAESVFADYERRGRTGRPVHWRMTRSDLIEMLDEFLDADDRHRGGSRSRPVRVELPFGIGEVQPVVLALADGRELAFRGFADRVDQAHDGAFYVSDYKTGKGSEYRKIDGGDPVQGGNTLQLGLYAEAARQLLGAGRVHAHYWMVNTAASHARYGYEWTPERSERMLSVLGTIADGIEGGVFPAVPGEWDTWRSTHGSCVYCPFDSVCSRDRGEHASSKADAPLLQIRGGLAWESAE